MKLEVGKSYTNCAGEIRTIVRFDECDAMYPFVDEHDQWYTKDGLLWYDCESEYDLIVEVATPEEPSVQPTKPLPDIIDPVINEMCWDMVYELDRKDWFNELKPALYEALKRYHKEYLDKPE